MRNTLETRLGIFFAVALIAAAVILEMIGGLEFLRGGLTLQARFANVQELKVGDPVKMAGKPIGRVQEIRFDRDRVLVVMRITDRTATVRTDSTATIKFTGLMGQNYVAIALSGGQGAVLTEGQTLETIEAQDISALVSKLDGVAGDIRKITGNLTDVDLNDLIAPFGDFLKESRPHIMSILTNAEAVSAQVASGQGTAGKLIYDEALYASALSAVTNLNATADDLRATINEARTVVTEVNEGRGSLGKLAKDEKLYAETAEAMTNLREILQKINQGQGSAGKLVNDESLYKNAKMTLQKLDKATEGLEDQGPLSVLGIAVNSLF
ncbi:MAG: MCE family protein [Verrucomicrobia bacterium]|nr:MCE family protein [Verrucomicrobiota bacterium]